MKLAPSEREADMADTAAARAKVGNEITIRLGNEDFTVRRELWAVSELSLDPTNPRLGFALRKRGTTATDKELHEMLWDLDTVKALYQSVFQNGGLIDDPIIHADGTVIEGNLRTVVLRE